MSNNIGKVESDPLFLAMTRPAMVFGITYSWLMLEILVCLEYFINTSSFKVVLYAGLSHVIGILVCAKEPRFMEIAMVWAKTWAKCINRIYHSNTASYDAF